MKPGFRRTLTRRGALGAAGATAASALLSRHAAWAQGGTRQHGLIVIGDLKYPADYTHFDYVNPDAPKGGEIVLRASTSAYNQSFETFDTLNMYVFKGNGPHGMNNTFATLMDDSSDEPGSVYGYAAREVEVSDDRLTYRFFLRPEAAFHDGTQITAEDVAFSINILRSDGHPNLASILSEVEEAVAEAPDIVRVRLAAGSGPSLPVIVAGDVPIFSQAWWEGRTFGDSLSEAPLGSGPYRVGDFDFGRSIVYERVEDFWAASLPVMAGRHNFDTVRYVYYRDRLPEFEAFKKGHITFREEFTSRIWANDYNFPAVADGRVILDETPDASLSAGQGWFFNTRRAKFADRLVREALGNAFDFEWTNKNIMYDSYKRTTSYFENSELKAEGKPTGAELALLVPYRDRLPSKIFDEDAYEPPVSDGSGSDRVLLGVASDLLARAGCMLSGGTLLTPAGEPFTIEFLSNTEVFEPHHNRYIINLARLGIEANYRLVDGAQYAERMNEFDFDMTVFRPVAALYPSAGLRQYYSSRSANEAGSRNYAGISDPVVDALVEEVVASTDWEGFVTASRALDRVLRASHYFVPHWYKGTHWLAFWDKFGRPPTVPLYERAVVDTWWHAPDGAAQAD